MKNSIFKRTLALFVAVLLVVSGLATTAFAAGERSEIYMVSFPRDAEANKVNWDRDNLQFMNGWHMDAYDMFGTFAVGSYDGKIAYCIEPGVPIDNGHSFTAKDETFWDNYPSAYNKTIGRDTIKSLIGRILQYGYNGTIDPNWVSQNAAGAEKLAHVYATQLLIWETIVGERDENFGHVSTGGKNAVLDFVKSGHPLRSRIMDKYNSMVTSVQNHSKVPSFMAKSKGNAATVELEWDGIQYTATLTDTNKVLGNYSFSSDYAGLKFTVSGNTLTITSPTAPTGEVTIKANKKDSKRMGLVVWDDGSFGPSGGQQDTVTYTQSVTDPIAAYVKLKVSYGSVEIVKTSEDGNVDGLNFRVQGDNVDDIFTTADGGHIQIDNLMPGIYTVTEQSADEYNPQDSQEVTVVAGQTATVTFNNTLRRGDLTVTKTAEDGLTEGIKFHLYGTSLSGLAVDEYATVGADGKAYFKNVLIGTGYTLEEVDTPERYVVPENQTAAVEWNTVTEKFFDNRLKKWSLTVTKRDGEKVAPQGNASLAGAVYGIYNGDELVDTYTTDADGKFTTQYYPCGDNWSLREVEPSEGYLLDESAHHIGAEAKNYEVEYSAIADTVDETVKKGNIALIKHTDNGDTQLETPETGAEFDVYLKSSGSYDAANDSERDHLICDENGFAQTKMLPYGIYTVHQTKGWDGRELLADFDVYIAENGQIYRYLANNSNFESFIKITKVDAETGKTIPYAGAGFQLYRPDGSLITQSFTYPTPTTIDTFYTNDEGWLLTPETLENGTGYSLVEVQAPYGYILNAEPVYFDVTADNASQENVVNIVKVTKENMPQKGTIKVGKTGEVFASVTESDGVYQPVYAVRGLPGAVYEISAAEDVYTLDGTLRYKAGEVVDTVTTDENGTASSKALYLGKYTVMEITAPQGMVLNGEPTTVELTYAGQEVEITETGADFYNEHQKAAVSLDKVMERDEQTGIGMNGEITAVSFGLYAAEDLTAADGSVIPADSLLETVSVNEDGHAIFTTDLPFGSYYLKETATDSHYVLSETKYPVVFEYAGQNVATVEIAANDGKPIQNYLIVGSVKGLKVDRETGSTIAGAVFGLFSADTEEFTEDNTVLTATSGEDGVFQFEGVPYGDWLIVELAPAEGYLPNDEIYPVQITGEEKTVEITVTNDKIPEIGTTATVGGEKDIFATETVTIEDIVEYQHLIPGKEYTIKGVLMDKTTGKPLLTGDEEIRSEITFVPEASSGEIIVPFTFDAKLIKTDTSIVVFESLYQGDRELAVHADIEDESQTVTVHVPKIGTQASVDGKKEVKAKGEIMLADVISYKNLTPGKEYAVNGILMDKATGKPFLANGKEIHAETTFTPDTADGEVTVFFIFNADNITKETEVVAFESICRDGVEIAVHADINDQGQTVKLIPTVPDTPKTGDDSHPLLWKVLAVLAALGMAACCGGFIASVMAKRKKEGAE